MFRFAARTDVGKRGGENQDAIGADPDHGTWFVADGMGGHAAGSVASGVVKSTLLELAGTMPLDHAILRAHEAVVANAAAEPDHTGMGSTVVAAQLTGSKCTIAWVGTVALICGTVSVCRPFLAITPSLRVCVSSRGSPRRRFASTPIAIW